LMPSVALRAIMMTFELRSLRNHSIIRRAVH